MRAERGQWKGVSSSAEQGATSGQSGAWPLRRGNVDMLLKPETLQTQVTSLRAVGTGRVIECTQPALASRGWMCVCAEVLLEAVSRPLRSHR